MTAVPCSPCGELWPTRCWRTRLLRKNFRPCRGRSPMGCARCWPLCPRRRGIHASICGRCEGRLTVPGPCGFVSGSTGSSFRSTTILRRSASLGSATEATCTGISSSSRARVRSHARTHHDDEPIGRADRLRRRLNSVDGLPEPPRAIPPARRAPGPPTTYPRPSTPPAQTPQPPQAPPPPPHRRPRPHWIIG